MANSSEAEVFKFFKNINPSDKEKFVQAIANFTDLSFFTPVSTLEQGEGAYDFELKDSRSNRYLSSLLQFNWTTDPATLPPVVSCWPILVLYHLYAGVAGLIQFTTVGAAMTNVFAPISNRWTFPLITVLVSTVVAIIVPSSGGQWVIQGFVTLKAAETARVSVARGMLALGVGDQMGNLVAPFWFVVRAEIARISFRTFFGYGLIFALLWFVCGVLAFTLLPC